MSWSPRQVFLTDADLLATAIERACHEADPQFRRTNNDILGNADAFVHAHIWPRYEWEPPELIWRPVWLYDLVSWKNPATRSPPSTTHSARASPSTYTSSATQTTFASLNRLAISNRA
ncbi:diadenosine tetraphosphate (Ap4A) HIT family hydrolase [Microbacterium sp. AK009]|uniref:hypothetical protein n=1 Tax=Microbacterium sp. AK009 TaxID=2723068 RepID=UPI0015CA8ED9|nr:hypothetical protein [Microbacterium sp. AK009]NYF16594.1 diadenosine tetraphosphate (Ap4A) HIT family hydrolase [Microbacterium sp. AK009]